jgi:sec-independent protein translocase protein TatA
MYPLIALPQGAEWLVILVIVIFVFGAAKLPELARGTGQALRIFKAESKALHEDGERAGVVEAAADRLAELDARQAELDAERARLIKRDAH